MTEETQAPTKNLQHIVVSEGEAQHHVCIRDLAQPAKLLILSTFFDRGRAEAYRDAENNYLAQPDVDGTDLFEGEADVAKTVIEIPIDALSVILARRRAGQDALDRVRDTLEKLMQHEPQLRLEAQPDLPASSLESTIRGERATSSERTKAEERVEFATVSESTKTGERLATASESTKSVERAKQPESPKIDERATLSERTSPLERAGQVESTKPDERISDEQASTNESTKDRERAKPGERTNEDERANSGESTTREERATHPESTIVSERRPAPVSRPAPDFTKGSGLKTRPVEPSKGPIEILADDVEASLNVLVAKYPDGPTFKQAALHFGRTEDDMRQAAIHLKINDRLQIVVREDSHMSHLLPIGYVAPKRILSPSQRKVLEHLQKIAEENIAQFKIEAVALKLGMATNTVTSIINDLTTMEAIERMKGVSQKGVRYRLSPSLKVAS